MTHPTAPLSVEGHRRLVERCQTRPISHVAAAEVVTRIEHLRREKKWSARRIALELANDGIAISVRTVSRHLAHLGLNRRRFLDPSGETNREPRRIVARWPGHLVHVDVKKTGHIPHGGGWRAHGRGSDRAKAVDRAKTAGARAGYVYLHSAIDEFSRLAYTEALTDERASTAIAFMHRARAFFAAHGIEHVHRVVTDNGACYRARDSAKVLHRTRHQRITPYTPRHNGEVERYNRILAEEFLYARTWTSETQRSEALQVWNIHYNYHRPHTSVGDRPACKPASGRCHQRHGLIQLALGATGSSRRCSPSTAP